MSFQYTRPRGMGTVSPGLISATGSAAGATTALLVGGAAGGPIGVAVSGVIAGLAPLIAGVINGCGESCEVTTQWANQAESALQQNIAAYFSLPVPRSTVDQQAALDNFTAIWNALVNNCNQPSLGSAGQRCITDRQAGACTWRQTTTPPWGSPAANQCWNWWNGYHDPIENDPDVTDQTSDTFSAGESSIANVATDLTGGTGIPSIVWIAAAALIVGLVVTK
jgi:hypothetical protein